MCTALGNPIHQDYRNFLGINGTSIPSHAVFNRFRAQLGMNADTMNGLSKPFLRLTEHLEGFLNLMIAALDSRPVFAAVSELNKKYTWKTPEKCTCNTRFSDNNAQVGRQRIKVNQNFTVKNTIIVVARKDLCL